jgi:HD-like signal output (HDOD) protein
MSAARKFVDSVESIGTLPTVYTKVNELVNDPNCPAARLGECISNDQAITSMILRLVNSALYGFPTYIDTVTKAVTIIGFKQTRDLVLSSSVINMFDNGMTDSLIDLKGFWKHSIATAVAAKIISSNMKKCDQEAMFTAGLLHNIGRLIFFTNPEKLPVNELMEHCRKNDQFLYKNERKILGMTATGVADALFTKWNLPPLLKEAAVFHHTPIQAPRFREEACCIHVADAMSHALMLGSSGENMVPEISEEAWDTLDIPIDKLKVTATSLCEQYPELVKIFFQDQ